MTVNTNVGPQYTLTFAYDPKGRRIQKVVVTNGVTIYTDNFLYDGWNLIAVLNSSFSLQNSFLWGNDLSGSPQGAGGVGGLLEVSYHGSSTTTNCFPVYDGNGNVMALVNAADGTLAANYDFGPFGELIRATGPMAKVNPFREGTKFYDEETDMAYYGYRFYNPSTGRWLSRDPIDEASFRQSYLKTVSTDERNWLEVQMPDGNEFVLVQNDPIDNYDVNGLLDPGTCVKGTVVVVGGAAGVGAAIAALPVEAIVLGVVIVGEGAVITYEICHKPKCGTCKPCIPPTGTKAIKRTDYPPSKPHGPIPTPHSHIVQVNQSPYPACKCFWNDANPAVVPGVPSLPPLSQFPNPPGGGGPAN